MDEGSSKGEIARIMPYWPVITAMITMLLTGAVAATTLQVQGQAQAKDLGRVEMRVDDHDAALQDMKIRLARIESISQENRTYAVDTNALVREMKQSMDHRPVR